MNVAIFTSAFYPSVGGVEEAVRQLAYTYSRKGISTIVLTNRWPRSLPRYEEYEGIPVYRLAFRVPEGSFKARLSYSLTHQLICHQMLNILKKNDVELIHVQCVSSNGYYALLAKRAMKLPLVVTTQGERTMDADHLYEKSIFMNRVLRQLLVEADFITACSKNTLDDMERYFEQSFGKRAKVVYNGVQLADFEKAGTFSHPKPYILGVGRLVLEKGFDILIEAFAKASMFSHELLIAGGGREREALVRLSKNLGLEERIHFLGSVNHSTAIELFKGCEFFVLPSRQEPMGIVSLEAMAAGKAVIASCVGGVPEIVTDGGTGLLVPQENVVALAEAIKRLANDVVLREKLGLAGRLRVERFSWETIADEYLEIYQMMCDKTSTI